MCRMLGVVSASVRSFLLLLEQAPRSMARLSNEHPDGWGIALGRPNDRWRIFRSLERAAEDVAFHELADELVGDLLLVHVRQKTHGPVSWANTHPFVDGSWVFTHNGQVKDVAFLEAQTSPERRARLRGDTDSERLFAFILTRFEEAGVLVGGAPDRVAQVLRGATDELSQRPDFGTASFLLSDGTTLFAHRRGAPLHLLDRRPGEPGPCDDCLGEPCVAVTTEPITDEPWFPLDDGDLVRVVRSPVPTWSVLR